MIIPVLIVIGIVFKWNINPKRTVYSLGRMFSQLLLIGYFLTYIFNSDNSWIIITILILMLIISSWIALGCIKKDRLALFSRAFFSITLGGGTILLLVSVCVLRLNPWYLPKYIIPLAGMIFANAMNSISLAAERIKSELSRGVEYDQAFKIAYSTSLIPIINSLFAVGIVSIPGMMTGQILSGISPLIAARYQIMVMCMIFGGNGISSALFLIITKSKFLTNFKKI